MVVNRIEETKDDLPIRYELHSNFPNPFNAQTTICFSLLKKSYVKINLYNILGELVGEICNNIYMEGEHRVIFNGGTLSSGIYFYLMEVMDENDQILFRDIGKMMFIK